MNDKMKAMLESYLRAFVVSAGSYIAAANAADNNITVNGVLLAGLIAIAGPGLRAINPKDPAFGLIANIVDSELNKLAEKSAPKKKTPAKKSSGGNSLKAK